MGMGWEVGRAELALCLRVTPDFWPEWLESVGIMNSVPAQGEGAFLGQVKLMSLVLTMLILRHLWDRQEEILSGIVTTWAYDSRYIKSEGADWRVSRWDRWRDVSSQHIEKEKQETEWKLQEHWGWRASQRRCPHRRHKSKGEPGNPSVMDASEGRTQEKWVGVGGWTESRAAEWPSR